MGTTNEDFYDAAIRHWIDGEILEEQEEYDNAVCMQGFAAECALKAILKVGCPDDIVRKYSHYGKELFRDVVMMLSGDIHLAAMTNPATGLRLSQIVLPDILFRNHPERRYYMDGKYSKEDAEQCRNATDSLIREITSLCLDGYMEDEHGRI